MGSMARARARLTALALLVAWSAVATPRRCAAEGFTVVPDPPGGNAFGHFEWMKSKDPGDGRELVLIRFVPTAQVAPCTTIALVQTVRESFEHEDGGAEPLAKPSDIYRLDPVEALLALATSACRTPPGPRRPPERPRTKAPLREILGTTADDYRDLLIKLTPLDGASGFAAPRKPVFTLAITSRPGVFNRAAFVPYRRETVGYFSDQWLREVVLPPDRMKTLLEALVADPALSSTELPRSPRISMTVLRPLAHGDPLASEVFVSFEHAARFAARVTDAFIGQPAFETAMHWEMNLP